MTLLERDECGSDEGELAHSATPSIFTEACNNETYVEVGAAPRLLGARRGSPGTVLRLWQCVVSVRRSSDPRSPLPPQPELLCPSSGPESESGLASVHPVPGCCRVLWGETGSRGPRSCSPWGGDLPADPLAEDPHKRVVPGPGSAQPGQASLAAAAAAPAVPAVLPSAATCSLVPWSWASAGASSETGPWPNPAVASRCPAALRYRLRNPAF